jgi:hypothetical protein
MATVDLTADMLGGHAASDGHGFYTLEATVDFSETSRAANDVLQMLSIPAGTKVIDVTVDVETVEDGGTFDVGDGADVDGYHDGIDATAAGITSLSLVMVEAAPNTILGYTNGKEYTAADTIDIKVLGQTFDEAKIRIKAHCLRLN